MLPTTLPTLQQIPLPVMSQPLIPNPNTSTIPVQSTRGTVPTVITQAHEQIEKIFFRIILFFSRILLFFLQEFD